MTIYERMTKELEARKDRSAWDKGVTLYALELVEELEERAEYEGRNPEPGKECREWMLNGAQDWNQYSWGGSSLVYDGDIAERLCTPSELKKPTTANADQTAGRNGLTPKQGHYTELQTVYRACIAPYMER